tara:strand:+ start:464 stop:1135 length:672 start_codon:yes stop_codon:yes gene_type:complete
MITINYKYPYKEIKRKKVNGKRLYETESGALPSVTTILDKTKPRQKRIALANWRKRVGEKQAQKIVTEAANTGTYMHAILESWVLNEEYSGESTVQSRMMAEVVKKNTQDDINEVWGSEVNLYYPGLYAGTTDLVGMYKGRPTIMDFKQTNKPKKREWIDDYFMQGAAYGLAHNALYETKIENIAIFMCSRDCEWQLFEVDAQEFPEWEQKWAMRVEQFYDQS